MKPVRLVSIDLDGTLVDTATEIAIAANLALRDHDLPTRTTAEVAALVGHGSVALMRALHAGIPGARCSVDALVAAFDRHYPAWIGRRSRPYPGAAQALARLRFAGIACVCTTNKLEAWSRALLTAHGLADYMDLVVGGDTLPWRKPDPRVLRHVIDTLGVDADEAAHLGDSVTDLLTARGAGLRAWAVPWGYTAGEPIERAGPDALFPSLIAAADHAVRSHLTLAHPSPRASLAQHQPGGPA